MSTFHNESDRYSVVMADAELKPKWRERFEFFETHGAIQTPEARAAFKALPYKKKLLINISWLGLFFGPIYFLILGMWKRALTMIGIALLITVIQVVFEVATGIEIPSAGNRGIDMAFAMLFAMTANYSYYLKQVKGDNDWNPFKGVRWW